jgi:hypothetical protein
VRHAMSASRYPGPWTGPRDDRSSHTCVRYLRSMVAVTMTGYRTRTCRWSTGTCCWSGSQTSARRAIDALWEQVKLLWTEPEIADEQKTAAAAWRAPMEIGPPAPNLTCGLVTSSATADPMYGVRGWQLPARQEHHDEEREVPAMVGEQEVQMEWAAFPESVGRVDLLVGHAARLAARWPGNAAATVLRAMGIAMLMAAQHPINEPIWVPGLVEMTVEESVEAALCEVWEWDLGWAPELPDMARLRVLLSDVRRELATATPREG